MKKHIPVQPVRVQEFSEEESDEVRLNISVLSAGHGSKSTGVKIPSMQNV